MARERDRGDGSVSVEAITDEAYHCLYKYTQPIQVPNRKMVGREKEMREIRAAMNRPELCNVLLLGEAGSGKAVANGTLVPVADERGYVPVEEIQVGDRVFDEDGYPTTVNGVFPQGMKHAYEVTFMDGTSVVCNDEHLWSVRCVGDDTYRTLTLREICEQGLYDEDDDDKWYIPLNQPIDRPYKNYSLSSFKLEDGRIPKDVYMLSSGQRMLVLDKLVRDVDMSTVPNCLQEFLQVEPDVLYDFVFMTKDDDLAQDVCSLASSLGIRPWLAQDDGVYYVLFYRPEFLQETGISIESVTDLGNECEMTCLHVDSPSHLFQVTEHHIVTHNTMLVQSTMMNDPGKLYLEVDLAKMVANCSTDVNQMAAKLKSLFDDVARYVNTEKQEVVLFMDEFHQVVQLSDAAVEALKPLLADSGVRGIRVITATTPVEFRRHISPNQPLVERLQRINLAQTDKDTTISILKGMAERYGVADQIYNDAIYESIYEYTNRYIPANAQPRKSILIMDAMIGWHRAEGRKIDKYLLADVIYESEGVNVAFKVDASKIKARLDKKVLSQKFATQVIEQRLQLCVADLNNKGRPMSSFLFSGSSGSGKAVTYDTPMPVSTRDGTDFVMMPASFVRVGDYLFDRFGRPTKVLGVFPQGKREVYRVLFEDGRHLDVSDNHLWGVYEWNDRNITVRTTLELMANVKRYSVPVNGALQLAGDGSEDMRRRKLEIMSDQDNIVRIHRDDIRSILDVSVLARSLGLRSNVVEFDRCWDLEWSEYHSDRIRISSIQRLNTEKDMVCFYVDNDEHLFQAGQFIVTHNTEMVKSLAEILFDDDRSLLRFDCTEYANADSLERFRRELTARVWEHPHSIILLDEIEKACSPVTRLLLQVLDDGRLIDENNREVSFTNAYIVMTTNAGSEIYRTIAQYAADDDGSGKSMARYDKLIRNSISTTTGDNRFPPELLGRIDCIVPFQPLSEQTMKDIARMKLQKLRREILQRHGIKVLVQEKVIRYLVEDNLDTDSDSGGARTVVSKLESEVTTKIAKFINENPGVYKIKVSVEGTLAADNVNKLLSDAYIQVSAAL